MIRILTYLKMVRFLQFRRVVITILLPIVALSYWLDTAVAVPLSPGTIVVNQQKLKSTTEAQSKLKVQRHVIEVPLQVQLTQEAQSIELTAFLSRPDQKSPWSKTTIFSKSLSPGKETSIDFSIPVEFNGPGHYQIDIYLNGQVDEDNGFSDRAILHILVDEQGAFRLLTGKQVIEEQQLQRKKRFEEDLKNNPNAPDIRLLFEETIQVPPALEEETKPSPPINEQSQVTPTNLPEVAPADPPDLIKKYSIDMSQSDKAITSASGSITVHGRLAFHDYNGKIQPLVHATVYLFDEETARPDVRLAATVTNSNGEWSFTVNNNDGPFQGGLDIYYVFYLANDRVRVQDCALIDETYFGRGAQYNNLADGTVLDYGTETTLSSNGAMRIFSYLDQAWHHTVETGGKDIGFVDSCYPYDTIGADWDWFFNEIDVEEKYDDGPDVVTHEYGHAIMDYAYGLYDPSPGGEHSFDQCDQNLGLAWSEGWATGFALSARPDGVFNWHEGQSGRNIERFSESCRRGVANEGRVAAAINDLLDVPDDCNGGNPNLGRDHHCDSNTKSRVPLTAMVRDTLWGGKHGDFGDFWNSLKNRLTSTQIRPAYDIMYYNYMGDNEVINDHLHLDRVLTSMQRSIAANDPLKLCPETNPADRGTWRIFNISAFFTNISNTVLSELQFRVVTLTGNTVFNSDHTRLGGVGSVISGPDVVLFPNESFNVNFYICLSSRATFTFKVDAEGIPQ